MQCGPEQTASRPMQVSETATCCLGTGQAMLCAADQLPNVFFVYHIIVCGFSECGRVGGPWFCKPCYYRQGAGVKGMQVLQNRKHEQG